MKTVLLIAGALLLGTATAGASNAAGAAGAVKPLPKGVATLASFADGAFLENIDVTADGDIYFTDYFRKTVHRRSAAGVLTPFAKLPIHPASVLAVPSGFVVAGPKISFTEGPQFTGSNHLIFLNAKGEVTREIAVAQARFLNGMARLSEQEILIADSILGVLWRLDLRSGEISPWLQHELLSSDPAVQPFLPGANGVKLAGAWVYVSNSSRGAIYRARVQGGAVQSNTLERFAATGAVDDFVVLEGGRVIAASHAEHLMDIDAAGTVRRLMDEGCGGCTAVGVRPGVARPAEVYVVTTGHILEGSKAPAHLLRVPLR